jgi:phosphoglycerate dehydrogenase-like enzyme
VTSTSDERPPLRILQLANPARTAGSGAIERLATVRADWSYTDPSDDDAIVASLPGQDVFIAARFTAEMGAAADGLRMIALPAAGYEKIDPSTVPAGCTVVNAYEHEAPIAEYVMMAAVALDHEVLEADRKLRAGDWSAWIFRRPPYRELLGRTIAVVGLGHIGRRVLHLAAAYGMRRIAVSRRAPGREDIAELGLDWAGDDSQLPRLLAEADFVVVSTPLLETTRGLIGARELALMKPDAYLINPARGPIVDEQALYEALRDRKIGGAAIDVWWDYPGDDVTVAPASRFDFASLDNVLMTPHISGGTSGTGARRSRVVAENVDRLYRGEPLLNVVRDLSRA